MEVTKPAWIECTFRENTGLSVKIRWMAKIFVAIIQLWS